MFWYTFLMDCEKLHMDTRKDGLLVLASSKTLGWNTLGNYHKTPLLWLNLRDYQGESIGQ
jgi:hypothetical protein